MKIEKRIIALCICALAIGIATALPLTYFVPQSATAQFDPWIDVDILYANVIPYAAVENAKLVNVVANFTFTPNADMLKLNAARIVVFNFHVYSDQTSIANITYSLVMQGPAEFRVDNQTVRGYTASFDGSNVILPDGTKYDYKNVIDYADGNSFVIIDSGHEEGMDKTVTGSCGVVLSEDNGEKFAQALINLNNAETVYIDVTQLMTITYQHQTDNDSTTSSLTTTLVNSEVLDHIEVAKTDFGFASGQVPDFMVAEDWYILPPDTIRHED